MIHLSADSINLSNPNFKMSASCVGVSATILQFHEKTVLPQSLLRNSLASALLSTISSAVSLVTSLNTFTGLQ